MLASQRPKRIKPRHDIDAGKFKLGLGGRTYIMGILNVTPDSFSDGGNFIRKEDAVRHAVAMISDGADMIDVGGESTRPGAKELSVQEETDRVVPVIEALRNEIAVPISVDTRKAQVALRALGAGASIVNDVSGLTHDNAMAKTIASSGAVVILMHMRGSPEEMQSKAIYKDVVGEIKEELRSSIKLATDAGIAKNRIIIDPGIGFSKTAAQNLRILNQLDEFLALEAPICIGTSRKSFIGNVLGKPDTADRLFGTLATCVIAIMNGASILRVHDVKEVKEAAVMTDSVLREENA